MNNCLKIRENMHIRFFLNCLDSPLNECWCEYSRSRGQVGWMFMSLCPAGEVRRRSVVSAARPARHWRDADAERGSRGAAKSGGSCRLCRELSATQDSTVRTAHCTRPCLPTRFASQSSTVPSARRTFELFATPALAYKYEGRWRGPAPSRDASRFHIDINWRCSWCPPHWVIAYLSVTVN